MPRKKWNTNWLIALAGHIWLSVYWKKIKKFSKTIKLLNFSNKFGTKRKSSVISIKSNKQKEKQFISIFYRTKTKKSRKKLHNWFLTLIFMSVCYAVAANVTQPNKTKYNRKWKYSLKMCICNWCLQFCELFTILHYISFIVLNFHNFYNFELNMQDNKWAAAKICRWGTFQSNFTHYGLIMIMLHYAFVIKLKLFIKLLKLINLLFSIIRAKSLPKALRKYLHYQHVIGVVYGKSSFMLTRTVSNVLSC